MVRGPGATTTSRPETQRGNFDCASSDGKPNKKSPADTLSFDDSDKRWLAYLRAHVGNLELLPAIVTHWERTAKPITRPLKVEELCKTFVLEQRILAMRKMVQRVKRASRVEPT